MSIRSGVRGRASSWHHLFPSRYRAPRSPAASAEPSEASLGRRPVAGPQPLGALEPKNGISSGGK